MKIRTRAVALIVGFGLSAVTVAGCGTTPRAPEATSIEQTATEGTPLSDALGSLSNPIPFGGTVVIDDFGEAGGPAWEVTIEQPRDMGPEILAAAVDMYGEEESYLTSSRPAPGSLFVGFTGSLERLSEVPAYPGYDLDLALIGSDGRTYTEIVAGFTPPDEYIQNITEMYSSASARFSYVQLLPEGVTGETVVVTMTNTGERVYFGTPR